MAAIVDQLSSIPDSWALVAVGNDKRPYQPEWQKNPLGKRQVQAELVSGRAVAVGVLAGPPSGGLLFVDHDGLGASEVLQSLGTSLRELPKSWAVTSGRDGRLQIIYKVPEPFWDQIKTTKLKSSIKGEQLELRWTGCQSVVLGKHPITGSYRWLNGRAPGDLPIAEAPSVLLHLLVYSARNRSACIRIPITGSNPKAKRIEFRCPDPSSNPYLAFAAMLMAGLDGIQNKIEPPKPVDKDLYELTGAEAAAIPQVPGSLDAVLDNLEKDNDFLTRGGVFTKDLIDTWIDFKRKQEVDYVRLRPHPAEFELYYDL